MTVKEAAVYFGLGEKKVRQIVEENKEADFYLMNGVKLLIKRKKFENYLNDLSSI